MKKFIILIIFTMISLPAIAGTGSALPPKQDIKWSFDGIFGTVDRQAAQRGYQVYKEVCASCHSLRLVSYRQLADIGFSEAEVKAIAAEATIIDGPNDEGEMFERPGRPSDKFASPYPNENAARAANGGAYPPDMSLIIKARLDGSNYLYSLLTGYSEVPEGFKMNTGMHFNPYFSANQIAMPEPLSEGQVDYQDGTTATVEQMAYDVTNFLQWAAEPEMEQRKQMGIKVMLFLLFFTVIFYLAKQRIWRDVR